MREGNARMREFGNSGMVKRQLAASFAKATAARVAVGLRPGVLLS
jgi:hypothetical protein